MMFVLETFRLSLFHFFGFHFQGWKIWSHTFGTYLTRREIKWAFQHSCTPTFQRERQKPKTLEKKTKNNSIFHWLCCYYGLYFMDFFCKSYFSASEWTLTNHQGCSGSHLLRNNRFSGAVGYAYVLWDVINPWKSFPLFSATDHGI